MGSLTKKTANSIIVFGDMTYDGQKEKIECPPSTVNNKKMLPKYRVPMQEGEIAISVIQTRFEKDENGKIVRFEDINKEKEQLEVR